MRNNLIYPFNNYDVNQIAFIANKIEYYDRNHGHSYDAIIDGENIDDMTLTRRGILAYILFLNEEIKYFNKSNSIPIIDINMYLNLVMNKINILVDSMVKEEKRPFPMDILLELNQDYYSIEYSDILFDVIDFLLAINGYKAIPGELYKIKKISYIPNDISDVSKDILEKYGKKSKLLNKVL